MFCLAACSGGGGGTAAVSPGASTGKPGATAAIQLALSTALSTGSLAVVPVTVTAIGSNGATITGSYLAGITVASNDPNDVEFSATASGANPTPSITLTSSMEPVFLVYNGNTLPAGTSITAATTTAAETTLALSAAVNPNASSAPSSAPTVATSFLNLIYVTSGGASPVGTQGGAIPIFIIAQDQNGNDVTGTFPSPIAVTLTNACDESLSIGTSGPVSPCENAQGAISNVAALTITSASEVVFVNYTASAASTTARQSAISVSTSSVVAGSGTTTQISIFCDAISFPYNVTETCQPTATPPPVGPQPIASPLARHRAFSLH